MQRPAAEPPHPPAVADAPAPARRQDLPQALLRAIAFFETLEPASLERLDSVYAPQARFRDPFNDLQGTAAIRAVFAHMFEQLDAPRFVIGDAFAQDDQAFVTWDFRFAFRRGAPHGIQAIHGSTHFRFDADGRIQLHRDYWDAAQELYEKLPVLGAGMRWLRRRLAAAPGTR